MEKSEVICFEIEIFPNELQNFHLKKFLRNKFNKNLYKGIYIIHVNKIESYEFGKINHNGFICLSTNANCLVLNPQIGDAFNVVISSSNKMGAFYSNDNISVFIPKQFCEIIPNQGDVVCIEIMGKRIDKSISCVAKMIKQEA